MKIYKSPVVCWKSDWIINGTKTIKKGDDVIEVNDYVLEIIEYNNR